MMSRQALDRIAQRITGEDIRLVGSWEPIPRLIEFRAEFARELGVSEIALLRCRDIVDILDLVGGERTSQARDTGQPNFFLIL
jgi:hypothetical protein